MPRARPPLFLPLALLTSLVLAAPARAQRLDAWLTPAYEDSAAAAARPERLRTVAWATGGTYAATYTTLAVAWYGRAETGAWRWFDDSGEWQQMDKLGHAYGAYQQSRLLIGALKWAGAPRRQVLLVGGLAGFAGQLPIELMDGFVVKYGASWADLAANAAGSGLALANEALWHEQRISLKFSFWPSPFAAQRPDALGAGLDEVLKDYNGQRYWLCANVGAFLPEGALRRAWPRWLGLAVGLGAGGMVGGYGVDDPAAIRAREYRRFFLSVDIDLSAIRTRSRLLRTVLDVANAVRLPLPAVEFGPRGTRFHPLFY